MIWARARYVNTAHARQLLQRALQIQRVNIERYLRLLTDVERLEFGIGEIVSDTIVRVGQ